MRGRTIYEETTNYRGEPSDVQYKLFYEHEEPNPRNINTNLGTLLLYQARAPIGDYEQALYKRWAPEVLNRFTPATAPAYHEVLSQRLGQALVFSKWSEISLSDRDDIDWSGSPDYRVLIPIESKTGFCQDNYCRPLEPVVGKAACRELIARLIEVDEIISGLYVITADQIRDRFGQISRRTLKLAVDAAYEEIADYEENMQGFCFNYEIVKDGQVFTNGYDFLDIQECWHSVHAIRSCRLRGLEEVGA